MKVILKDNREMLTQFIDDTTFLFTSKQNMVNFFLDPQRNKIFKKYNMSINFKKTKVDIQSIS